MKVTKSHLHTRLLYLIALCLYLQNIPNMSNYSFKGREKEDIEEWWAFVTYQEVSPLGSTHFFITVKSRAVRPLWARGWRCSPRRWHEPCPRPESYWRLYWTPRRPTRRACSPRWTRCEEIAGRSSSPLGNPLACQTTAPTSTPPPAWASGCRERGQHGGERFQTFISSNMLRRFGNFCAVKWTDQSSQSAVPSWASWEAFRFLSSRSSFLEWERQMMKWSEYIIHMIWCHLTVHSYHLHSSGTNVYEQMKPPRVDWREINWQLIL